MMSFPFPKNVWNATAVANIAMLNLYWLLDTCVIKLR